MTTVCVGSVSRFDDWAAPEAGSVTDGVGGTTGLVGPVTDIPYALPVAVSAVAAPADTARDTPEPATAPSAASPAIDPRRAFNRAEGSMRLIFIPSFCAGTIPAATASFRTVFLQNEGNAGYLTGRVRIFGKPDISPCRLCTLGCRASGRRPRTVGTTNQASDRCGDRRPGHRRRVGRRRRRPAGRAIDGDHRRSAAKEGRADRSIVGTRPVAARDICPLIQQHRWHPPRCRTRPLGARMEQVIISSKALIQRPELRVRGDVGQLSAVRRTFCNETAGQRDRTRGQRSPPVERSGDDFPEEQDVRLWFSSFFGRRSTRRTATEAVCSLPSCAFL